MARHQLPGFSEQGVQQLLLGSSSDPPTETAALLVGGWFVVPVVFAGSPLLLITAKLEAPEGLWCSESFMELQSRAYSTSLPMTSFAFNSLHENPFLSNLASVSCFDL